MPQAITKTEVYPILAPRGGLNYSLPADQISDLEMSECQNVFMEEGYVKKRYGYGTLGGNLPLPGVIIGMDQFYTFAGNSYLLAITTKGVFYLASPTSSPYWETLMEKEEEDDCETTWTSDMGANGAVADETTIKKVDSKSQKISPAAGFTTGLMAHRDQALGDKSAYSFVRLWVRSSVAMSAGDIQFCIDDTAGCGSPTETLNFPALTANTWKLVFLEASDPTNNMNAIASLGIKAAVDKGACDIYIDDIYFVKAYGTDVLYDSDRQDTVSADYMRQADQTDLWWVMTNGIDVPQYWTGNVATAMADLISTPPSGVTTMTAKQLIEFKDYLLLLDVELDGDRYPQRIFWSDTGTPSDFDSGNASYQDLTGSDWIVAAIKFKGDYVVILKERSIWLGYATGYDNPVFQFDQKVTGAGCAAPNTVESLGDEIIFLGWDNVYVFDGIDYIPIGDEIKDELLDKMNPAQIPKAFGVVVEEQKEYWLFVASTNSDYCDMAWVFNYDLNKWTKHIVYDSSGNGAYMSYFGYFEKQATLTIGDLVGTIGQQTWRIGDRTILEAAPTTLFGDTSGYVYEYDRTLNNDNGTAIDAWFSSKDFNPTDLMQRWRLLRIDCYFTGAGMDLEYSTDRGKTWTQITSFARNDDLETPQTAYCKLDLLLVRLRCRNAVSGEHFEFSRLNLFWKPAGRKL